MFVDDIVMMAVHTANFKLLKDILEGWAADLKMKVLVKKTQVISPDNKEEWFLINQESGHKEEIKSLAEYQYLGIDHGRDERETSTNKSRSQGSLLRLKQTIPDQIESYRAIWKEWLYRPYGSPPSQPRSHRSRERDSS